jgi:hypothetical protein
MRRVLLCTGILGGGTALTFAAAALAATLLPGGTVVPASSIFQNNMKGGPVFVAPVPMQVNANGGGAIQVDTPPPVP